MVATCVRVFLNKVTVPQNCKYIKKGLLWNLRIFKDTLRKQPPEPFCMKGVLRNLAQFTRKHLCQSLILNKVAGHRPATLLKKRLWHRCFPVNFTKFLGTPFLQNSSGRLLLTLFYGTSPVAASDGFRFPACNFI